MTPEQWNKDAVALLDALDAAGLSRAAHEQCLRTMIAEAEVRQVAAREAAVTGPAGGYEAKVMEHVGAQPTHKDAGGADGGTGRRRRRRRGPQ